MSVGHDFDLPVVSGGEPLRARGRTVLIPPASIAEERTESDERVAPRPQALTAQHRRASLHAAHTTSVGGTPAATPRHGSSPPDGRGVSMERREAADAVRCGNRAPPRAREEGIERGSDPRPRRGLDRGEADQARGLGQARARAARSIVGSGHARRRYGAREVRRPLCRRQRSSWDPLSRSRCADRRRFAARSGSRCGRSRLRCPRRLIALARLRPRGEASAAGAGARRGRSHRGSLARRRPAFLAEGGTRGSGRWRYGRAMGTARGRPPPGSVRVPCQT